MQFTDTHIHLYAEEFNDDRQNLISEAIDAGVTKFFIPNIDSSSVDGMLQLQNQYPSTCFAMMGLHPCSVKENFADELKIVEENLSQQKFFAIGEIGIDLYWDVTFQKQQEEVFVKQLMWASQLNLPVSIHSRNATDLIIELVKKNNQLNNKGIFHCFSGTTEQAHEIISLGFYLGIGGVITFKNSGLDKVVEQIDLKNMVLETDAPYLAPVPNRGKRNIPSYLKLVAEKISSVKNISLEEVASVTTQNAKTIFGE
jgi:TatD DNase family protein